MKGGYSGSPKRRVAAPHERCQKELGQQAIWKARRLGRPVEAQCSRKREEGSPFCLWHQPDRVETKRHLTNEQAVAIYAEVVALRLRFGPPPIGRTWWGHDGTERLSLRLAIPSMGAFAKAHGMSISGISGLLSGTQYRSIGFIRERFGWWTIPEVVAALLWLRREEGGLPGQIRYRAIKASGVAIPAERTLLRFFGSWSRVTLLTGIPSVARHRDWTPEEDDYLMDATGLQPISVIARALGRSFPAVKERVRTLGVTIYTAQGYVTLAEAVRSYGANWHQLRTAALSGHVPYVEGQREHGRRIIFFDPLDIEAWLERRRGGLLLAGGSE